MKFKTYQEAFDSTIQHFSIQKRRGGVMVESRFVCQYFDKCGGNCAIGFHIPAGHEALNSSEVFSSLMAQYPDLQELFGLISNDGYEWDNFWMSLQAIHDFSDSLDVLVRELGMFCEDYKLNSESIKTIEVWS